MFNKKYLIIPIALIAVFGAQIGVQAQEEVTVETVPYYAYLETYNIPELLNDPMWSLLTQNTVQTDALQCIQPFAYLTAYNIAGLEDDPLWQRGMIEFAVVRAGQGA